jgi:4-hydroxy-tetrahydrodipicolinate synthase
VSFAVALLTPFDQNGRVDLAKLRAHTLWLTAKGAESFVVTGRAGEFLYLSDREREAIHRTVLESAMGRPVLACTWDTSPATAAYLSKAAVEAGAHAVLVPPPLLYDLDDDALLRWYETAGAHGGRTWAYHLARRTPGPLGISRVDRLFERGLVDGLVDETDDPWRIRRLAERHPGQVWAAHDAIVPQVRTVPGLAGIVSVAANVWPSFTRRVYEGDAALQQTMLDRHVRTERAGGLRALKSLKRFGCRSPLIAPADEALRGLPSPESADGGRPARSFPPG